MSFHLPFVALYCLDNPKHPQAAKAGVARPDGCSAPLAGTTLVDTLPKRRAHIMRSMGKAVCREFNCFYDV